MSVQSPATAAEILQAVSVGRAFQGPRVHADHIAVLTGALRNGPTLTGPLAQSVLDTMSDYTEQYLTGGGRERAAWHVVYYVTIKEPDAPATSGTRRVIATLTADGDTNFLDTRAAEGGRRAIPGDLSDAVIDGILYASQSPTGNNGDPSAAYIIATDRGDYPLRPRDAAPDGDGLTFTLWHRDSRVDVRQTRAVEHFTDRAAAYQAMRDAEASGEPYVSPSGYRGTYSHAWITRSTAEDAPAIGTVWADYKGEGSR